MRHFERRGQTIWSVDQINHVLWTRMMRILEIGPLIETVCPYHQFDFDGIHSTLSEDLTYLHWGPYVGLALYGVRFGILSREIGTVVRTQLPKHVVDGLSGYFAIVLVARERQALAYTDASMALS